MIKCFSNCPKTSLITGCAQSWGNRRQGENDRQAIPLPLDVDGYLLNGWKGPLAVEVRRRRGADFTGRKHDNAQFEASWNE